MELEESASVDGASPYRTFRSIILPVAVPGLVATFILVLVFAWNEYLIALFLATANAPDDAAPGRRAERDSRAAVLVHVGAHPDHDRCRSS